MRKSIKFIIYVSFVFMFTFSMSSINVKAFTLDDSTQSYEFQINVQRLSNGEVSESWIETSNAVFEGSGEIVLFVSEQDFSFGSGLMANNAMQFVGKPNNNIIAHWSSNADNLTNNGSEVVYYARNNGVSDDVPFYLNSLYNKTYPDLITSTVIPEVDYVKGIENLKKWLQGDDSVVKHGDPNNNEVIDVDGNIPTPQGVKLYNDGQCVGLVWDNPKMINKLVGKYGDVSIEIKFRPTLNYNLDLFRSKTLTPTDYIGGITSSLSDHGSLYNGFMTMFSNRSTVSNKLDKYNIKFDNKYIFTDNILDTDYANVVCKMLGHKLWYVPDSLLDAVLPARGGSLPANTLVGEMTDKKSKGVKAGEGGSAVDVGLKVLDSLGNLSDFATNVKELMNNVTVGHSDYMIRYYMMDGNEKLCSKWVNVNQTYDDNANATDEQSTNFKDVENNPVDNPNYNYPTSTSSSSSTGDSWWTHFDDSTKTVFDSLSEQMEQLTESDGGFMQFFGELFATFPWLAGIFMLALSIALFLRIFGR